MEKAVPKMGQEDVQAMFTRIRQVNGLIAIIESNKHNGSITLQEVLKIFERLYGEDPLSEGYSFNNHHQFLTSTLAYICLPSAIFYNQLPETLVSKLQGDWGLGNIAKDITLRKLVRCIRNAVSHGRVNISKDVQFTFQDVNKKGIIIFEEKFNQRDIQRFCQALAYWCITKDDTLKALQ